MNILLRYWLAELALGALVTWLVYTFSDIRWIPIPVVLTFCAMAVTLYAFILGEPTRRYHEHGEDYADDTMR